MWNVSVVLAGILCFNVSNAWQQVVSTLSMRKDVVGHVKTVQNGNFLYPCTSNDQCKDTTCGTCHDPTDPNGSFCDCVFMGPVGSCSTNKDCCDNACVDGQCQLGGGGAGTVCSTDPDCKTLNTCCGDGCSCHAYEEFGYCTCP